MKSISLRLESEQYQRLRLISFATDKPVAEMIRDAIDDYLNRHTTPRPGQEWFWSEAWQAAEREAETDLRNGNVEIFDNDADFLASLK